MSRSFPIWVDVQACIYSGSKSYGVKETGYSKYKVGSSASNSHLMCTTNIRKIINVDNIEFRFTVDGMCIKKMYFEKLNKGTKNRPRISAGKHLKTITKLNKIKTL